MATIVLHPHQTIRVTEVSRIQVTEIVTADETSVRALRIWGSDGTEVAPTIEIIVSAETAAALKIATPELVF